MIFYHNGDVIDVVPISVIEDIKAEIEEGLTDYIIGEQDTPTAKKMFNVMDKALEIIDKHTKGVKE